MFQDVLNTYFVERRQTFFSEMPFKIQDSNTG